MTGGTGDLDFGPGPGPGPAGRPRPAGEHDRTRDRHRVEDRGPAGEQATGADAVDPQDLRWSASDAGDDTVGRQDRPAGQGADAVDPQDLRWSASDAGDDTVDRQDPVPGPAAGRRHARSERRRGRPRSGRRLAPKPAGTRRFLVLGGGTGTTDVAALDLDSKVLVRLHGGLPVLPDGVVEPFDVLDGAVSPHEALDDPARPEALLIAGQLERAGVARGRRARRALRAIVAPPEPHLLGFPGTSWPYWEFHGTRPSVAIVTPSRGPMLFLRAEDGTAWARFGWYRTDNWLPVHDGRAAQALVAAGRRRLTGKSLTAALGFRPAYLVVAVGRPQDGYCTKQVLAVLPRP
ncbi:MAG: hypothetical protein M0013_10060 [Actinomycetota bacterium]|nr:hypothetical protein [Actinomycetota bacterium]